MREKLLKGDKKILFSAPHCVEHTRNGEIKMYEINTDTIVKELHKRENISAIYKVLSDNEDANWDIDSNYKKIVQKYITENNMELFVDVHGMDYKRECDICIGTAFGKTLCSREDILKVFVEIFRKYGYTNIKVDMPFSANNIRCLSNFVATNCKIPALQIEINNKYRFEKCKEYDLEKMITCFQEIIMKVENGI